MIYLSYFQTPDGRTLLPRSVAGWLAERSSVPVLCIYETYVGTGVLGGAMIPFEEEGHAIGAIARRVVEGEDAEAIGILPPGEPRWIIDERAMKRHGLAHSVTCRRMPKSASANLRCGKRTGRVSSHGAVALLLQSALIIGLLAARARQRKAENEKRLSNRGFPRSSREARSRSASSASPTAGSSMSTRRGNAPPGLRAMRRWAARIWNWASGSTDSGDQRYLEYLASGKALRDFEQRLRMPNGSCRLLSVSTELVNLHGEPCYISMAKDITDMQEAEEARQKLQQASRLGMLGELAASIAHEVNQPLGAILSNADAAAMLMELPESAARRDPRNPLRYPARRPARQRGDPPGALDGGEGEPHMVPLHPGELAAGVAAMVRHDCKRRSISLKCDIAGQPAARSVVRKCGSNKSCSTCCSTPWTPSRRMDTGQAAHPHGRDPHARTAWWTSR